MSMMGEEKVVKTGEGMVAPVKMGRGEPLKRGTCTYVVILGLK